MKNNCILITAHKLNDLLAFTLNRLKNDFDIYIHIDKKSNVDINQFIINNNFVNDSITFIDRKKVYWGGFSQIDVTIDLLEEAYSKNKNYKYFIFISGEDFPSKSNKDILEFLDNATGSFIEYKKLPSKNWDFNGGLDRLNRYWLTNFRNRKITKLLGRVFYYPQKFLGIKRSEIKSINEIYGGCNWFNLDNKAVEYILQFLKENKSFKNRFFYTRACDEIFFQTILLNNNINLKINNSSLRYIDWKSGPDFPKKLEREDIDNILRSNSLFSRKITDLDLMKLIDIKIKNNDFN